LESDDSNSKFGILNNPSVFRFLKLPLL
jgi:hypothetical protein